MSWNTAKDGDKVYIADSNKTEIEEVEINSFEYTSQFLYKFMLSNGETMKVEKNFFSGSTIKQKNGLRYLTLNKTIAQNQLNDFKKRKIGIFAV